MPATAPNPGAALPAAPPHIIKEKVPASANTDTATRQTVAKMCEYIRAGAADPIVQGWAEQSKRYAGGNSPEALCWGAWWLVKHAVKFARDEPRLFSIGDGDALDLLVAPAVLVRQKEPAEDCDGFTMLLCAILSCLGIDSCIVTIAADPSDRTRWSHVFPMALIGKQTVPLDCSHGKYPGWIVPGEHIFRWQAWNLEGHAIDQHPVKFSGLHGYTRPNTMPRAMRGGFRGFGDDGIDVGYTAPVDTTLPTVVIPPPTYSPAIPPPLDVSSLPPPPFVTTPSGVSTTAGVDWTSLLNNLFGTAGKVATVAELPAGSTIYPSGAISTAAPNLAGAFGTSGSILPWLIGGGLLLWLFSSGGRGRR